MSQSKAISAGDAAILALVAENPGMSETEFVQLLTEVSSDDVASIARAIVGDESVSDEAILSTARALREWASSNTQHGRASTEAY